MQSEYKIFYNIFQLNKFAFARNFRYDYNISASITLSLAPCLPLSSLVRRKSERAKKKKIRNRKRDQAVANERVNKQAKKREKSQQNFSYIILCADCISYPKFVTIKYLKTMKVNGPRRENVGHKNEMPYSCLWCTACDSTGTRIHCKHEWSTFSRIIINEMATHLIHSFFCVRLSISFFTPFHSGGRGRRREWGREWKRMQRFGNTRKNRAIEARMRISGRK